MMSEERASGFKWMEEGTGDLQEQKDRGELGDNCDLLRFLAFRLFAASLCGGGALVLASSAETEGVSCLVLSVRLP